MPSGLTVNDLKRLTDELMGFIAQGHWRQAADKAEQIRKFALIISKHCEKMAEESPEVTNA